VSLETGNENKLYELIPEGKGQKGHVIKRERCLIGSSEACDIIIRHQSVNAIHAVLEKKDNFFKIYDMHSDSGTFINGTKVVAAELKLQDSIMFGTYVLKLNTYNPEDLLPPILDVLTPTVEETFPILPKSAPNRLDEDQKIPIVEYPLAKDPRAEFSEYIFEDADNIYPIFNYQINQSSVEVIILFEGIIYSVDFLPLVDGKYKLAGSRPGSNDVEYAYLGKNEKLDLLEISDSKVLIHTLFGYECFQLSDQSHHEKTEEMIFPLEKDDILRFSKGSLQIFVRLTEKPPRVKSAPLLRREGDLKKYLLIVFLFIFSFLIIMSSITIDEEIEKEKIPERIATILYKEPLTLSIERSVVKNKLAPKKIIMKAPTKKVELKKEPEKKLVLKKTVEKSKRQAKKKRVVAPAKKVSPNKSRKNNMAARVRASEKARKAAKNIVKAKAASNLRKSNRPSKAKGNIDTFKSFDFSNSVNSLLAKGGTTKSIQAKKATSLDANSSTLEGAESATLKRAKVSKNIGSLAGIAKGKLDASTGTTGLAKKKSIYTAGMPGKTVVRGGMDPDIIKRILRDHIPQFRFCYQSALDDSTKHFQGVVKLNFTIGASGHVSEAGASDVSGAMPASVRNCARNVLLGIKFPEPKGGGRVGVNQPISFHPKIR